MEHEVWKQVKGYGGNYFVSSHGRIKSMHGKGRIMKTPLDAWGYPNTALSFNGKAKSMKVHSLVAEYFLGSRPDGMQVNHKNGIKIDNRPENLEWCTPAENTQHKWRSGLHTMKMKAKDMPTVLSMFKEGNSRSEIAKKFGVTRVHIGRIINGKKQTKYAK